MAYSASKLRSVANGSSLGTGYGTNRIWHYISNDLLSAIVASGYFNSATDLLRKGDIIVISADQDGTPRAGCVMVDSTTGAATVTVTGVMDTLALVTTVTLTNGDSGYVPSPVAGTITNLRSVLLGGAVTTNDAVVTGKIGAAGAGVAITNGVVTIANSGSAIGDVDTASPTALNTVAAGDLIYFTVSGTPGGSRTATVVILISVTG